MLVVLALRTLRTAGAAACAAALLGTACAPAPSRPREVLASYLRWIGRDPARTLELLAPEFHASHGLRLADLHEVLWGGWRVTPPAQALPGAAPAPTSATAETRLEASRLAWLFVQRAELLRDARLQTRLLDQTWQETTGSVLLRVQSGGGHPFEQRFDLSRRDASAPWRIRAIEQRGVDETNVRSAFAAYPSLANLDLLKRVAARRGGAAPPR